MDLLRRASLVAFPVFALVVAGCAKPGKAVNGARREGGGATTQTQSHRLAGTGRVVDSRGLDGCRYLIQVNTNSDPPAVVTLEPVELPADLQHDGLEIVFEYVPRNDRASICMAGQIVELTSVRRATSNSPSTGGTSGLNCALVGLAPGCRRLRNAATGETSLVDVTFPFECAPAALNATYRAKIAAGWTDQGDCGLCAR